MLNDRVKSHRNAFHRAIAPVVAIALLVTIGAAAPAAGGDDTRCVTVQSEYVCVG